MKGELGELVAGLGVAVLGLAMFFLGEEDPPLFVLRGLEWMAREGKMCPLAKAFLARKLPEIAERMRGRAPSWAAALAAAVAEGWEEVMKEA